MDRLGDFLTAHWLGLLLAVVGAVFAARRRWHVAAGLGLAAVGSFVLSVETGLYVAGGAIVVLMLLVGWLTYSTQWNHWIGWAVLAVLMVGAGSLFGAATSRAVVDAARVLANFEVVQPAWLLGLLTVPWVVVTSFRSLAGLGPIRRWVAIGLRCLVVTLLVLALAEVRLRKPGETTTVIYLVDRSLSIPQDVDASAKDSEPVPTRDRRWKRIKDFLNAAVAERGPGHERDQSGVIVFGRRPRLVLPPAEVPRLNFSEDVIGTIDDNYTDIAAAIKLAIASFPEGAGRRIVLLSDGNENLGDALEQARVAAANGVQIDTVPLAEGYHNENEVLVHRVEAPAVAEEGGRLPIRVLLRSFNPNVVVGELALRQRVERQSGEVLIEAGPGVVERGPPAVVQLRPGLNAFSFRQTLANVQQSYTYEAVFTPRGVANGGTIAAGLPGDRLQNNAATTHVLALGRRRILFVESRANAAADGSLRADPDHGYLCERLRAAQGAKFQLSVIHAGQLPSNPANLGLFLSTYDCVVLANVPANDLTDEQMELIRSNTYDQGCGLVMIGGPDSFGAGGFQSTPVEKALPVDCDIQSVKVAGKGGLVLIMHATEAADGNALQKQLAKLAVQKLSPVDMVGVLYYDGKVTWHVPFREVAGRRNALYQLIDRMTPGDMPDFDPFLQAAHDELTKPEHKLAVKHIILISDGDPSQTNTAILRQMRNSGVTCTTVGVATHDANTIQRLRGIASATNARFYGNPSPKAIPAIYIQETRTVSQSFISEQRFVPQLRSLMGPTDKLPTPLPPLYGFVRSTLKPSQLATAAIDTAGVFDQRYPILAYWQYGLGKSVAHTSDARSRPGLLKWDQDWVNSEIYDRYWQQVLGWALRGVESGKLSIATEYRDGVVHVTVDARDDRNRPMTDLEIDGAVTAPPGGAGGTPRLKFVQRSGGVYEAEFKADEAGSYFVNAQAVRTTTVTKDGKPQTVRETDSVRSGVTIPYSPEFADMESNSALMRKLSETTGGKVYTEGDRELADVARGGGIYRPSVATKALQPVWYWLLLIAGCGFLGDVAVRRIALVPAEMADRARRTWDRLRGRTVEPKTEFLERLQSTKTAVGETLERAKSTRRFEPAGEASLPPLASAAAPPPLPKPVSEPTPAEATSDDAFARLIKAKRKALEDRERGSDTGPSS